MNAKIGRMIALRILALLVVLAEAWPAQSQDAQGQYLRIARLIST